MILQLALSLESIPKQYSSQVEPKMPFFSTSVICSTWEWFQEASEAGK